MVVGSRSSKDAKVRVYSIGNTAPMSRHPEWSLDRGSRCNLAHTPRGLVGGESTEEPKTPRLPAWQLVGVIVRSASARLLCLGLGIFTLLKKLERHRTKQIEDLSVAELPGSPSLINGPTVIYELRDPEPRELDNTVLKELLAEYLGNELGTKRSLGKPDSLRIHESGRTPHIFKGATKDHNGEKQIQSTKHPHQLSALVRRRPPLTPPNSPCVTVFPRITRSPQPAEPFHIRARKLEMEWLEAQEAKLKERRAQIEAEHATDPEKGAIDDA